MATRTSSPPGSRSSSSSSSRATSGTSRSGTGRSGGSGTRTRSGGKSTSTSTKAKSSTTRSRTAAKRPPSRSTKRPAPRAVRSGTGPVARTGQALLRGLAAVWLGIAHALGAGARGIGRSARDLEPEHRRDGAGLSLVALSPSWWPPRSGSWCRAASWTSRAPRSPAPSARSGWLVPLALVWSGWRLMRDPVGNGPAGRQAIGWTALALGSLGVVHVAADNPQPVAGDTSPLREGGGAVGYVVASLLLDLLRSSYVVVPVLAARGVLRPPGRHLHPGLQGAREAARPARRRPRPWTRR